MSIYEDKEMRKILLNDFNLPMEAIVTSNAHIKWFLEEDCKISQDMLDNIIYLTGVTFNCTVPELEDYKLTMSDVYLMEFRSIINLLETYDMEYTEDLGVVNEDDLTYVADVYCTKRGLQSEPPIQGFELCGEKDVNLLVKLLRHIDNEDIYTEEVLGTPDHFDCWPHLSAVESLCDSVLITPSGTNSAAVWDLEEAGFKHRVVEYDGQFPVRCQVKLRNGSVYYG